MDAVVWILIVVVLLAVAGAVVLLLQRKRSQGMQERFGPEYERTVSRAGGRREAESELAAREHRRNELDIVPLDPADRARYQDQWRQTQAAFVDDPSGATAEADELVTRVMRDRGYPVDDDFEGKAAVVSVDHPVVAENYRSARALFRAHQEGLAGTDDLRQAFVHYRSLFAELLDTDGETHQEAPMTSHDELSTADLAAHRPADAQVDAPVDRVDAPVDHEPATDDTTDPSRDTDSSRDTDPLRDNGTARHADPSSDVSNGPLLASHDSEGFRARWTDVQTAFVDSPRSSVEQADALVAEVMQHLATTFADERSSLERQWDRGDDVATDDLRTAFQRYRSFFERLLAT